MSKASIVLKPNAKVTPHSRFKYAFMYRYSAQKPKFVKNSRKTNPKGPKKMYVPKDKIVYVVDIFSNEVKTPIMGPGLWMLAVAIGILHSIHHFLFVPK